MITTKRTIDAGYGWGLLVTQSEPSLATYWHLWVANVRIGHKRNDWEAKSIIVITRGQEYQLRFTIRYPLAGRALYWATLSRALPPSQFHFDEPRFLHPRPDPQFGEWNHYTPKYQPMKRLETVWDFGYGDRLNLPDLEEFYQIARAARDQCNGQGLFDWLREDTAAEWPLVHWILGTTDCERAQLATDGASAVRALEGRSQRCSTPSGEPIAASSPA